MQFFFIWLNRCLALSRTSAKFGTLLRWAEQTPGNMSFLEASFLPQKIQWGVGDDQSNPALRGS